MDTVDLTTIAGVIAATAILIEFGKLFLRKWLKGREKLISALLPIAVAIVSKLAGNFKGIGWTELVLMAIAAGIGAGVVHDKLDLSGSREAVSGLFGKVFGLFRKPSKGKK